MSSERSIIVSGIPAGVTRDQLEIHFQKRKNGGGDVASLIYPIRETPASDCAIVTFEAAEVAESVLRAPQQLQRVHLGTRPLSRQVFHNLTADIDHDLIRSIPEARNTLQWQFGLQCKENETYGEKYYTVRGNWFQIDAARRYLEELSGRGESHSSAKWTRDGAGASDAISSKIWRFMGSDHTEEELPSASAREKYTSRESGADSESWPLPKRTIGISDLEAAVEGAHGGAKALDEDIEGLLDDGDRIGRGGRGIDLLSEATVLSMVMDDFEEDGGDDSGGNHTSLQVDADVFRYLEIAHQESLKTIQDECNVDLKNDGGTTITSVVISPASSETAPGQVQRAKQQFVSIYESTFHNLKKYDLHVPEGISDQEKIELAALDTQTNVPDVLVKQEDASHYAIYGSGRSIEQAKRHFFDKLSVAMDSGRVKVRSWEADLSDKIRDMEPLTADEKPKPKEEIFESLLTKIREGASKIADEETPEDDGKSGVEEDEVDKIAREIKKATFPGIAADMPGASLMDNPQSDTVETSPRESTGEIRVEEDKSDELKEDEEGGEDGGHDTHKDEDDKEIHEDTKEEEKPDDAGLKESDSTETSKA
ncbi:uncharacterized protein LOC144446621 [Glandiceps talaboti]